jgi:hypothetical protein
MALVQVRSSNGEETQPGIAAAAAQTSGTTPRWQVVVASFAAIVVAWLLSITVNAAFKPAALVIPAGIGLFAMLYAVTQGLERVLEPLTAFFFCTKAHTQNRNATLAAAVNLQTAADDELPTKLTELARAANVTQDLQGKPAQQELSATGPLRRNRAADGVTAARAQVQGIILPALVAAAPDPGHVVKTLADELHVPESEAPAITRKAAVDLAAAAQAELDQRRADKAVAYWALASILGLLLSATLGIYLLHIVGLRSDGLATDGTWAAGILSATGIRHALDLLVTGLAIGGGTKPLHDLISNLQAAKISKKDPSQTQ